MRLVDLRRRPIAADDAPPGQPTVDMTWVAELDGAGEVAGEDDLRTPIAAGTAAVWAPGEQHTSWATTDMTVVIVQSRAEPSLTAA
ncbi:hypothetical protein GXB85_14235 [Cellulomonas sp. APG4]|uniref:hypothetical protein n=1 Tax=Cellulomonas sp. APG4 TaxID=1538656 RepID=UPI00137A32A2|nr:hypothetical protein [Cellulomonas sp. APG4]NCT92102.1 hypothetical protein [Cellulomonas sp. APG4]